MSRNKNIKFSFIIILLYISILGVSIMFRFSYANNYNLTRDSRLYSTTITNLIYECTNEINKGPSKSIGKIAYITIDDGPSIYTKDILDVLNRYNAKATFFMIDSNMKSYPNTVRTIIENGNTAGFHSVSHDIHKLYKTRSTAKEEFDVNKETLLEVAGIESNIVRLPYGSKPYTPYNSYEDLVKAGYKMWDWDIDTEDWKVSSEQVLENVKTYSKGKDNIIILMHEKVQTAKSLNSVLEYLSDQGYEFVPIGEDETPRNYWLKNLI